MYVHVCLYTQQALCIILYVRMLFVLQESAWTLSNITAGQPHQIQVRQTLPSSVHVVSIGVCHLTLGSHQCWARPSPHQHTSQGKHLYRVPPHICTGCHHICSVSPHICTGCHHVCTVSPHTCTVCHHTSVQGVTSHLYRVSPHLYGMSPRLYSVTTHLHRVSPCLYSVATHLYSVSPYICTGCHLTSVQCHHTSVQGVTSHLYSVSPYICMGVTSHLYRVSPHLYGMSPQL